MPFISATLGAATHMKQGSIRQPKIQPPRKPPGNTLVSWLMSPVIVQGHKLARQHRPGPPGAAQQLQRLVDQLAITSSSVAERRSAGLGGVSAGSSGAKGERRALKQHNS